MCGIVGYKGSKDTEVVLDALKKLEYRGYDSWGIASININKIQVFKQEGRIGNITIKEIGKNSGIAIGHTRWATHGAVTRQNAHPILSQDKKIAVVHNGIIENYIELRRELEQHGIPFETQTDTEVIPNLIQLYMNFGDDFQIASKKALNRLKGSYAIVAIHQDFDELIVARDGSPLVIGVKDDEYFVASDVTAFLDQTKNFIFLEDGEYAVIGSGLVLKKISDDKKVIPKVQMVAWDLEQAKKGAHPHFMIKEILEQPIAIQRALLQDESDIHNAVELLKGAGNIYFAACGSSLFASEIASYWFSRLAKTRCHAIPASEFGNFVGLLEEKDLVIAISQSGETADTIESVKLAKERGAKILSIINSSATTLSRLSDVVLKMNCGPEICVLSTKSFTAELGVLSLLAHKLIGKESDAKEVIPHIDKLIRRNAPTINALAQSLRNEKNIYVLGRGIAYPVAKEGALKIKEVSYIHAEGFCGGELKHGSIALIDKDSIAIALPTGETRKQMQSNCMEIKARGGRIIAIDSEENESYDHLLKIDPIDDDLYPFVSIILLQLLAYHLALVRDCDPDKPRNLAKSVTVK